MSQIRIHQLAFSHTDAAPLLENASCVIPRGLTGLVAENGAGKTSLLRLISGELRPTAGAVCVEPSGARVCLVPQEVEALSGAVAAFASEDGRIARRLRSALRVEPNELSRWETLSPGERTRWQVGAALASEPDVLLLDEPTNHLDPSARQLLITTLLQLRALAVIVSHDRELLDAVTTRTLRIEGRTLELYRGGYGAAREQWEASARLLSDEIAEEKARVNKLEKELDRARRASQAASRARSAGRRMRNRNDSDARSAGARTLADWADKARGRQVGVARAALERAQTRVRSGAALASLGSSVFARWTPAPRPVLFQLEVGTLRAGDFVLAALPALTVRRDDRIWISGDNGRGKSTLLRELLRGSDPARVLYLPQELGALEAASSLSLVRALPQEERGRVLSVVGALGVSPERLLASERPSPGEARKLRIATGLGRHAWVLVLDEPTNHMDLPSIERLESALAEFPGALVLVSHDAALAARVTRTRWHLGREGLEVTSTH